MDGKERRDQGAGRRVAEFARIDRETAEPTTDPREMAMTRARPAGHRDFAEAKRAGTKGD